MPNPWTVGRTYDAQKVHKFGNALT